MKLLIAISLLLSASCFSATVILTWDHATNETVSGYTLYWGEQKANTNWTRTLPDRIDAVATNRTIIGYTNCHTIQIADTNGWMWFYLVANAIEGSGSNGIPSYVESTNVNAVYWRPIKLDWISSRLTAIITQVVR